MPLDSKLVKESGGETDVTLGGPEDPNWSNFKLATDPNRK
jgi:hypothetical protein